ncbi:B-cell receptor CD22-like isoform X2 [Ranitomeya variabilis]|uniref:B-cell receptor CD22-like isoform X2 n=1 Tax=Ranitomeya variabilis TaxID=490064 RepID=UPI004055F995
MDPMKQIYLLLIYQGFYLGSVCQRWTFPEIITALIGSCVEIPCTYHPAGRSGSSSAVWYLSIPGSRTEILNTKNSSSSIGISYKGRTSLVPGDNSCTLRIDPVRREDGDKYYYPGIAEDITINAADKQSIRYVYLSVTDEADVRLDLSNRLTEGEPTTILCSVDHTCRSSPPSLQWNKPGQIQNQSEISDGSWSEQSSLTYIASYVDDGTPVRCTATYHNGQSFHESGTLNIKYAAIGVQITVKNEGEFTKLTCDFRGSRPDVTHYTWKKDGSILHNETGKILTIYNNVDSYGQYSCIAHNSVGDSSSSEIYHEDKILYSPVIWGSVAGALFLLLFIVFLCLCLRRKKKSSSIHETLTKISNENDMAKDDNHHGNIQSSHNGLPPPARSEPSFDISFAGNQVIYSNSEMTQPSTEVEYSVISHRQPNQAGQNSSRARHDDDVEYATLKK